MDEAEVLTIVIEMAAHTLFAIGILQLKLGVIPVLIRYALRHFFMAFQALESRGAGAE